jgi:SAM-dependent methyltransferase
LGHKIVSQSIISNLGDILTKFIIIEGSSKMIRDFRKTIDLPPNVRLVKSLFEEFETTERFDAIEMGFILEHVDDPLLILKRYSTFLKAGGSIFISVPNARSLHRLIGYEAGLLDDLYRLSAYDLRLGHKRYFDSKSLEKLISRSGLDIVKREGIYLKPFSTSQLRSLHLLSEVTRALFSIGIDYPEIGNAIYLEVTH